MKMKLMKRIALMATAGLGAVGVLFVILEMFGLHVFGIFHKAAEASVVVLLLLLIILLALAGMCAYAFWIAFKGEKAYKARMVTLKGTRDDVVLIQQDTLDDFVKSVIGQPEGVTDIAVSTQYHDMALDVQVSLTVNMDTDIAASTANMQKIVREQLEAVNGIQLSGVTVIISGINVPENTEGMTMPWAVTKDEEKREEAAECELTGEPEIEKEPEAEAEPEAEEEHEIEAEPEEEAVFEEAAAEEYEEDLNPEEEKAENQPEEINVVSDEKE